MSKLKHCPYHNTSDSPYNIFFKFFHSLTFKILYNSLVYYVFCLLFVLTWESTISTRVGIFVLFSSLIYPQCLECDLEGVQQIYIEWMKKEFKLPGVIKIGTVYYFRLYIKKENMKSKKILPPRDTYIYIFLAITKDFKVFLPHPISPHT